MAEPLKPQFYVLRPNGFATPLIAVDELPHHIEIQDVPRILSIEDISENNMQRMPGKHEPRHDMYAVIDKNKTMVIPLASAAGRGQPLNADAIPYDSTHHEATRSISSSSQEDVFPGPKKYYGIREQPPNGVTKPAPAPTPSQGDIDPGVFSKHEPLPPWQQLPDNIVRQQVKGKKVYCSHWMSTGECDYAQQGCLYKHEMPLDVRLLETLGLQDIPKWYREKHGIGKLTAVPGSGAHYRSSSQGSSSPATSNPNWRQRNPQRSVNGNPGSRSVQNRVGSRTGNIASPRPLPARSGIPSLLDLESRPSTPNNMASDRAKGLLASKFAPLRPATSPSSEAEGSISSTTVETGMPLSLAPTKSAAISAPAAISKWQEFSATESTYAADIPRRSSFATDYETEAMQELEERKAVEKKELAESEALAASEKEQRKLKEAQELAVAEAKKQVQGQTDGAADSKKRSAKTGRGGSIRARARAKTAITVTKRTAEPITPPDSPDSAKVAELKEAQAAVEVDYRKSQLRV